MTQTHWRDPHSLPALAHAWNPPGDPGAEVDRAIVRARGPFAGLPRETDDGEILAPAGPLPTAAAVALESERPGVLPAAEAPPGPGDRARDLQGVLVEVNSIAVHLPELVAQVRRLAPEESAPGWLTDRLGTVRGRLAVAAAGVGAVRRELRGPAGEPEAGRVEAEADDAVAVLCHSLYREFLDLWAARRTGAGWDEGHWRRFRGALEAAAIVARAQVQGGPSEVGVVEEGGAA